MEDVFRERVRTAAAAAWWTVVVAAAFFGIQWVLYLLVISVQPDWVLSFWGPGATWDSVRTLWFYALLFLKLSLWPVALIALWLTLWGRRLSRRAPEELPRKPLT